MTEGLDRYIKRVGVRAANRYTRRSFIGRVGATTGALVATGMAVGVDTAEAYCAGESVSCLEIHGHNGCQYPECYDGGWAVSHTSCDAMPACGGNNTIWHDCCRRRSACRCSHPHGKPSCCNDCIWNNQYHGAAWCGGGSQSEWTVGCRWYSCA